MWLPVNRQPYNPRLAGKTKAVHAISFAHKGCCLLFFLALAVYFPAFSQKQRIKFEHIGTNMGLSQSSVMSILQDSRGFMWFGTYDGLNKYDGYKFTVYKYNAENENSPGNNMIMDIAEDDRGNLWLATWGGGLNMFDWKKEKFIRYRYNVKDTSGIGNDYINKLLEDSEGNLWIATEGGGLNMYDKKNNRFIRYSHDSNNPGSLSDDKVTDLAEDAAHNLWIGTTSGGLNLFDKKTKTFRHFLHDDKNSKSLSDNYSRALFVDSKNQLWIGTRGQGLNLFDRKKEEFIHFKTNPGNSNSLPSNVIRAINEDEEGNLWIGTENGGLSIFNTRTGIFDNYLQDDADNTSLNSNSITAFCNDDKGNMWMGAFSGGINLASRDANKFIHYRHSSSPASLNNNIVLSIFEDSKENLWIGTDGGGLNLFDDKKNTFTSYKHDPLNKNSICGNYVLEIFEDSEGNLWIGTWGNGLTIFNKEKNTFKHFTYDPLNPKGLSNANVWAIGEDADKNIWIGTYGGGLCRYDRKNNDFITWRKDAANPSGPASDYINMIYGDKEGNLWVATNGSGLDLFNKTTKTFTHFIHKDSENSISNNDVFNVTEDRKGNLWIGTGLGLNRMDVKTRQFTSYHIKDGMPGNSIAGLLFDKNDNLWMSTFNGLSRFNPATKVFKNFDINDGLQSNEFKMNSCYRSSSGRLYFGGINGFNGFFPDSIVDKKYEPPLVFTDFQIFNKQIKISEKSNDTIFLQQSITDTKELVLPYNQSVITFEFASLNYVFQNKKQYSYKLESFDKDWNDIGTRHTATYTNLDPGTYIFKVRGLNNDGKWSSKTASIKLTITPPFWLTWWFRIAVLMALAGSVIVFFHIRTKDAKRRQKLLEQKVKEQTVQLVNLHHEEHNARLEAEKAREEADSANENLGRINTELEQFVYIASHDLREPLRTTASFVQLFQQQYKGKLDLKADSYLHYIADASGRMKMLIDGLLEYSRIGSKKELQPVNGNLILQEVLTDLGIAIKESGANVMADKLPLINAHPTAIKLLFQNLIANSIKFRKKDVPPIIRVAAEIKDDTWKFSFTDNGIGIDQQYSEKIFAIFQRLHTRAEYEGSGIGLAHCKKIVELHGGKIWIESVPGEGAAFYFTIPKKIN
jgi:ligand-binding sensor domain-containing protein/signal transduction histidine kinase